MVETPRILTLNYDENHQTIEVTHDNLLKNLETFMSANKIMKYKVYVALKNKIIKSKLLAELGKRNAAYNIIGKAFLNQLGAQVERSFDSSVYEILKQDVIMLLSTI